MTALEGTELGRPIAEPPPATSPAGDFGRPAPATGPDPTPAAPPVRQQPAIRALSLSLTLLGAFLLGFAFYLYGLSGVQEARSQTNLYKQLGNELSNAVAPVGPTTAGAPVAILDIPSIGIRDMVVVEGTTPENLSLGPGHLRDTPLPGQAGLAVIYGRRASFGAPFARLGELRRGDIIRVITGQGAASYEVVAFGSSTRLVEDPSPNRLVLLTAGSAAVPTYYMDVDADLVSKAQPSPGGLPDVSTQEIALSGDGNALPLTVLWALALAMVSAGGTVAALRWSPWLAYLSAAPVALAVLWNLYQSLSALLPNVY